jgi:hypothetical protein
MFSYYAHFLINGGGGGLQINGIWKLLQGERGVHVSHITPANMNEHKRT